MVVDYYRDFDHTSYITTLQGIIETGQYRFHIKSLLVSNLATITSPLPSERILAGRILDNRAMCRVFVNSVHSPGWITFLLNRNFPGAFLAKAAAEADDTVTFEDKVFWILRLLIANMEHSAREIIHYLHETFVFEGKQDFIQRFLSMSQHWYIPETIELFEVYLAYDQHGKHNDNYFYYLSLERMYPFNPGVVHQKLESILLSVFEAHDEINDNLKGLIEHMLETLPEESGDFLITIVVTLAEKMRFESSFDDGTSPLYRSMLFSDSSIEPQRRQPGELLLAMLRDVLIKRVGDKEFIKSLVQKHKHSDSTSVLKLLALILQEKPQDHCPEIVELLDIITIKGAFKRVDDMLQYAYRVLIARSLTYLSPEDSAKVIRIILSISHPYEKELYLDREGKKCHRLTTFGKKKFLFLDAIPEQVRKEHITLRKNHQELSRKFGRVTDLQLDVSRARWGSSTAPLAPGAYLHMNDEQWITSMEKFNDQHVEDFSTGGKLEHKRAFTEAIKKNPARFYGLICKIFTLPGISHDYYGAAIDGLTEAKYPISEITPLYHKFISLPLNTSNTLNAVHKADYFISEESADSVIIEFLCQMALEHPDPVQVHNPEHPMHDTVNSVRGAAAYALVRCNYNPEFTDRIFTTLETAASDPFGTVRIGILGNLAYLNILDLDRAFRLFLVLTDTDEILMLDNAFWSANYYRQNYYEQLKTLVEKVIANPELHENGGTYIVLSWLMGYDKDGEYFHRLMASSKEARLQAIHVAEENLISEGNVDPKCLEILISFLGEEDEDFVHPYSTLILRKFKPKYFMELYPFMQRYSKTELLREDPAYFIEYLLKCVKEHPALCLELIASIDFSEKPDIQKRGYHKGEPVQLILSIYNALNATTPEKETEISKALDIFDIMLTSEYLRSASFEALEAIQH